MRSKFVTVIALLVSSILLSGCIIAPGGYGYRHHRHHHYYQGY
jgi:hypothetical protein